MQDQLEYMKGLILTHVRKPMSRDQVNFRFLRSLHRVNVYARSIHANTLYIEIILAFFLL